MGTQVLAAADDADGKLRIHGALCDSEALSDGASAEKGARIESVAALVAELLGIEARKPRDLRYHAVGAALIGKAVHVAAAELVGLEPAAHVVLAARLHGDKVELRVRVVDSSLMIFVKWRSPRG